MGGTHYLLPSECFLVLVVSAWGSQNCIHWCGCRAPGRAREVKIAGVKRTIVVFVLLGLGVFLLWRTHALLYLAVATLVGV